MQGSKATIIGGEKAEIGTVCDQYHGCLEAIHEGDDMKGCPRAFIGFSDVSIEACDQKSSEQLRVAVVDACMQESVVPKGYDN